MKIKISKEERYPVYSPEKAKKGQFEKVVEVDRETFDRWKKAERDWEAIQDEMGAALLNKLVPQPVIVHTDSPQLVFLKNKLEQECTRLGVAFDVPGEAWTINTGAYGYVIASRPGLTRPLEFFPQAYEIPVAKAPPPKKQI